MAHDAHSGPQARAPAPGAWTMPGAAIARVRRHGGDVSGDPALPGVLADIAEVAGRETAIKIALEWGGRWVHMPSAEYLRRRADHNLVVLLGTALAAKVAARVGGGSVYIPMARRACAVELDRQGTPTRGIAERLHTNVVTIRRYIRHA